jgi:two-component system chemotaxis sensor kinase CheA
MDQGEMLNVRGQLMPLLRISRIFDIPDTVDDPMKGLAIIVDNQQKKVALLVDSLIGQQQVVIKNLGEGLGKVQGVSGGAIMADGSVGLILDISELVKMADKEGLNTPVKTKEVQMEKAEERPELATAQSAAVPI